MHFEREGFRDERQNLSFFSGKSISNHFSGGLLVESNIDESFLVFSTYKILL